MEGTKERRPARTAKLTKTMIDKLEYTAPAGGRDVLWDTEVRGLGLRVYPSGLKSFVLSYRTLGQKRLMALGDYGELTLIEGRVRARRHLLQARDGVDPLIEKKREKQGETMRDLCRHYMQEHATPHKKKRSAEEDRRKIERYILPEWANRKVKSITANDVASLHRKIGENSIYEANRTLSLLSCMFRLAQQPWQFLGPNSLNPTRGISRFKELKRDRWVTPQELPKLAEAIAKEESIYVRAAIWLFLLTGLRKNELLSARWEQVDFHRRELCIPENKSGRPHYVPLSSPVIAILNTLPRSYENPFILPGRLSGKHLIKIDGAWYRIRKAAGVEDVRLHDLRRTLASWLAQAGNSLHLIGRVLNHANTTTTQVYARFGQDHVREALEAHGKAVMAISEKEVTGAV
jgi:integrase